MVALCLALLAAALPLASGDEPATATTGAKPAPPGLIGMAPQALLFEEDLALMRQAGVRSIRAPLPWFQMQREGPASRRVDWTAFDRIVGLAADQEIGVLPFAWGTPEWAGAEDPAAEPMFSRRVRAAWSRFLRRAVARYGPGGNFWFLHPELPEIPIRVWQVWNEPNIIDFSLRPDPRRYSGLVRLSTRAIRQVDPSARILLAGLFGRIRKDPPNVRPVRFLRQVLRGRDIRRIIDGIALHPYFPDASEMPPLIRRLRWTLRQAGRPRLPLWVTEMGWGSDTGESMWERGLAGQARELNEAMRLLTFNQAQWRIRRIYWFSWIDAPVCQFCDSSGLFTDAGDPKPSWEAFNSWTGGDPSLP